MVTPSTSQNSTKRAALFNFRHPPVRADGQLHHVSIPARDGCNLSAMLGIPETAETRPFKSVLLVHGFAAEKTENGLFSELASALLGQGFSILAYDWRGLGASEGDFKDSSLETHTDDLKSIIQWLQSATGIETSELCVVGFSLGAALVAKAVRSGQAIGGAVFLSPATQVSRSMWPRYNTRETWTQIRSRGFFEKPGSNIRLGQAILESLRDTDLGDSAFNLGTPLLVCHGTADVRIPIKYTRSSFRYVKEHDVKRVCFAEFKGASHSFRPQNRYWRQLIQLLTHWLHDENFRESDSKKLIPPSSPKSLRSAVHAG